MAFSAAPGLKEDWSSRINHEAIDNARLIDLKLWIDFFFLKVAKMLLK